MIYIAIAAIVGAICGLAVWALTLRRDDIADVDFSEVDAHTVRLLDEVV